MTYITPILEGSKMAEKEKETAGPPKYKGPADRMAAARAAKSSGPRSTVNLDDRQKFALRTMQQARSGLKTARDGLLAGYDVPADLIDACSKINASVGKMLFD